MSGAPRTTGRARLGSEHHENDWEYLEYSSSVERPSGIHISSEVVADDMGIGWAIAECVSCKRCTENIRDERLREAGTCCEHDRSTRLYTSPLHALDLSSQEWRCRTPESVLTQSSQTHALAWVVGGRWQ